MKVRTKSPPYFFLKEFVGAIIAAGISYLWMTSERLVPSSIDAIRFQCVEIIDVDFVRQMVLRDSKSSSSVLKYASICAILHSLSKSQLRHKNSVSIAEEAIQQLYLQIKSSPVHFLGSKRLKMKRVILFYTITSILHEIMITQKICWNN